MSALYIAKCRCYYRNFSHVPVTKNCSLFWLLLHIKLPVLILWFCSVYRKSLLLHKISLMLFNKLSMLILCVRIVYCKLLLLYNIFSHVSKRTARAYVLVLYCILQNVVAIQEFFSCI